LKRALATVDLEAVRQNVAALTGILSPATSLLAVVKANAYGHGAVPVARACVEAGAASLGVATIEEAAELREAGLEAPLLVLGPLTPEDLDAAFGLGVEVAIWSYPFLKNLVLTGHRLGGKSLRVHVKLDTGMHRLGLYPRQLPDFLDAIEPEPEAELAGLMTHFATADEPDEDFFRYQLGAFEEAAQVVLRTGTRVQFHCANSAATMKTPESHFDMVRCGIALYGLSPFQGDARQVGLVPALRLSSYLAVIKPARQGDSVGYGASWTAPEDTNIGVIPIGYADGVGRGLSNNGEVLIAGRRYPVVGRVSMDQLTVDLGSGALPLAGAECVLIGVQGDEEIPAEEMAGRLGTINYEIVCDISGRVERRFTGPEQG
jgi:alanine racemase